MATVDAMTAPSGSEAVSLVLMPKAAVADNRLELTLRGIHRVGLLITDELGYPLVDVDGERLLYQVMTAAYESRSMVITTDTEFSRWGTVLGDDKLANALVDRIVHHGLH